MQNRIYGLPVGGSTVVYELQDDLLKKGLLLDNNNIIWPDYTIFNNFYCNLAAAGYEDYMFYIDRFGNRIIEKSHAFCHSFSENRAFVQDSKNGYLLIDSKGNEIVRLNGFDKFFPFSQGYARISETTKSGCICSFINKAGAVVIPKSRIKEYSDIFDLVDYHDFYSEGLIRFKRNGYFGFMNLNREEIIAPLFNEATKFQEGLSGVVQDSYAGFINKQGEEVIPFIYEDTQNFCFGCAPVKINGKWGIINRDAKFLIEPEFDFIEIDKNGLVRFLENDLWGYMTLKKDLILPAVFDWIESYHEGIASFVLDERLGVADIEGKILLSQTPSALTFSEIDGNDLED